MYALARALLFQLDPEASHHLAISSLKSLSLLPGSSSPRTGTGLLGQPTSLMGLQFGNRLGLAAGLDKNGEAIEGLARLGFGFIEVGTVTPRPQPGNPRPRMFRIPEHRALINRLGFNNAGVDAMTRRLKTLRQRNRLRGTLVGVNIGKNKDTPLTDAASDYTTCMEAVYPYADYLTLNLSSPNTPGLRKLQSGEALSELLSSVTQSRRRLAERHERHIPLLLKVAPDLEAEDIGEVAQALNVFDIDGLIATNTTIERPLVEGAVHAAEAGGLSGYPLAPLSRAVVARFRELLGKDYPIIGVGGVVGSEEAGAMVEAGANLLQIYTGFIYQGPDLIRVLLDSRNIAPKQCKA